MRPLTKLFSLTLLLFLPCCTAGEEKGVDTSAANGFTRPADGWSKGDTIPSGSADIPPIQILEVHANGSGEVCGVGRTATLNYKAMLADGTVVDPGTRPYSFQVGPGNAIRGWHIVVSKMCVGDSFTIRLPQQLAYGPSKGDFKFDMELISVR